MSGLGNFPAPFVIDEKDQLRGRDVQDNFDRLRQFLNSPADPTPAVKFTGSETVTTTPFTPYDPFTLTSISGRDFTTSGARIIVPTAGLYSVTATIDYAAGGQRRMMRVYHVSDTGTDITQLDLHNDITPTGMTTACSTKVAALVYCSAGEGIRIDAYSDLNVTGDLRGYMARIGV